MTMSSTKELFTPFKDPEQEFRSSRKLFKTLSLDESRSPVFDLFSDLEENFEGEVAKIMAETMEEYMIKTRADYGSGVTRPKIDDKDHFELKGQFLKELRDNTFSGSDHEDANEHIEKVLEIVDLFHIPNINQDQILLRAFPMSLTGAASRWEVILFNNGLEVPTRQIRDSKGAIPTKTARVAIQEMAEYSQKWHNGTSKAISTETYDGLAAIQAQLNNLGRDIKKVNEKIYAAQVGCELCKGPHYTNDCPLKEEGELAHTKLTVELADRIVKRPKEIAENVLVGIGKFIFPVDFIILDMPEDVKVPLIIGRPFLSTAHAKIDVFKRKFTLRNLGEINTIEEGEVVDKPMIEEVKTRNDNKMVSNIIGYPSGYDKDEKIHIGYAYNAKFSCMIGFQLVHANFFPNLPINVMSKKFYNSIMKDKIEFRGRNELGNFANVPVFIGNFYVITDFTVVEDMDPYLDEGIGEVVVGEPFCEVSCVETRRFDGIITIHDEEDSVTYQMAWSNPRFKHLTNEQCNKILPLLKVSEQEKMKGILHPYQKLKGFYKGVLNLEPDAI
ncbi:reverse transcriptase domain-containing protein [Tanacetum coccineum]